MKTLIVYYSRSGRCKKVAEELGKYGKCDVENLSSKKSYKGFFGFFKGIFDSLNKKKIKIGNLKSEIENYDLILIGTPVWTAGISPVTRSFLVKNSSVLGEKNLGFFCTYGIDPKDTFEQMEKLSGKKALCTLSISEREIGNSSYKNKAKKFYDDCLANLD